MLYVGAWNTLDYVMSNIGFDTLDVSPPASPLTLSDPTFSRTSVNVASSTSFVTQAPASSLTAQLAIFPTGGCSHD